MDCGDGVINGDETDIDCGGSVCPGCAEGQAFEINDDYLSNNCDSGISAHHIIISTSCFHQATIDEHRNTRPLRASGALPLCPKPFFFVPNLLN